MNPNEPLMRQEIISSVSPVFGVALLGKTECSCSQVRGDHRRIILTTVPLADMGGHEQYVSSKLNKVLVTPTKPHLLQSNIQTQFSNLFIPFKAIVATLYLKIAG